MSLYVVLYPSDPADVPNWSETLCFTTSSGDAQSMAATVTGATYHEVTIGSALPLE